MKLFGKDYLDYYIEEESGKNICGEIIWTKYRIKYKVWKFGIPTYVYWEARHISPVVGYYYQIISDISKENLIKKYKSFTVSKNVEIIKGEKCL